MVNWSSLSLLVEHSFTAQVSLINKPHTTVDYLVLVGSQLCSRVSAVFRKPFTLCPLHDSIT